MTVIVQKFQMINHQNFSLVLQLKYYQSYKLSNTNF